MICGPCSGSSVGLWVIWEVDMRQRNDSSRARPALYIVRTCNIFKVIRKSYWGHFQAVWGENVKKIGILVYWPLRLKWNIWTWTWPWHCYLMTVTLVSGCHALFNFCLHYRSLFPPRPSLLLLLLQTHFKEHKLPKTNYQIQTTKHKLPLKWETFLSL